ncbi:MAG: diaminopimelate epimerase [Chloroflexi bacterium]|nr:diaminopimelate epimerase [Chloroflexota bacterium]
MTGSARLAKYHGLGNDYLVCDPDEIPFELTPERVRLLCHRNLGLGADGVLLLCPGADGADVGLRILNPDGSEAEKSGNGLRIFAAWLVDTARIAAGSFRVWTRGGVVGIEIERPRDAPAAVTVDMGLATVRSDLTRIDVLGERLDVVALSIGNPHCVVPRQRLDPEDLRRLGPAIETHASFPNRTNVQLVCPTSHNTVEALIWERGAGETMASGSSACAVAVACHHLGLTGRTVQIRMPGGDLAIRLAEDGHVWMRGPAEAVYTAAVEGDLLRRLGPV